MTIEALREVVLNGDISLETRRDAFDTAIQSTRTDTFQQTSQAIPPLGRVTDTSARKLLNQYDLGRRGRKNKIAAIRYYRDLTGLGLWESEVIVEAAMFVSEQQFPGSRY